MTGKERLIAERLIADRWRWFEDMLERLRMPKQELANRFMIDPSTISGWRHRGVPQYAVAYLTCYLTRRDYVSELIVLKNGIGELHDLCAPAEVDAQVRDSSAPASSSEVLAVEPDTAEEPEASSVEPEGCSACGATAQIFEDAARYRKIRERQRRLMRERRKK